MALALFQSFVFASILVQSPPVALDLVTRPVRSFGPPVPQNSSDPELSRDGRWLVFASDSALLVTNKTLRGAVNLFRRDNQSGQIQLLTTGLNGSPANGTSSGPLLSADGTKLVFQSDATNLAQAEWSGQTGLYLMDLTDPQTHSTIALRVTTLLGKYSATPDGRYLLFESPDALSELDMNAAPDLYRYDTLAQAVDLVTLSYDESSATGGASFEASISHDGRYVVYVSSALNVVPNTPSFAPQPNVYLRDMSMRTNILLSKSSRDVPAGYGRGLSGATQSGIRSDGASVFFTSATLLTTIPGEFYSNDAYRYSVQSNSIAPMLGSPPKAGIGNLTFSENGRYLAFTEGDRLYIKDTATDQNRLVSTADGLQTNLAPTEVMFSPNGRFLLFNSSVNLTGESSDAQQYAFDQETSRIRLIGSSSSNEPPNQPIVSLSVSETGWVAFSTFASNLPGDLNPDGSDVFLQNILDDAPPLWISGASAQTSATGRGRTWFDGKALSVDGRHVVYSSESAALVFGDANAARDIFVYDTISKTNRLVTYTLNGMLRTNISRLIATSADARIVAYFSREADERQDSIFVFDTIASKTTRENILPTGERATAVTEAKLSANGRYLAFSAGNQFFVRDLEMQETKLAAPIDSRDTVSLSPSGRYLVRIQVGRQIVVIDWQAGTTWYLAGDPVPASTHLSFSAEEMQMSFFGRSQGSQAPGNDLYVLNVPSQSLTLCATNAIPPAALNAAGNVLVFQAYEGLAKTNLVRIRSRHLPEGSIQTLALDSSTPFRLWGDPFMSDEGRYILLTSPSGSSPSMNKHELFLFDSVLTNLIPILHDTIGELPAGDLGTAALSADGRHLAFLSSVSDLVPLDLNEAPDIFFARIPVLDSNGNGIEDGWEILHPDATDPRADPDGDGMQNGAEYLAGTDPTDPNSRMGITNIETATEGLLVTWSSVRGKRYQIETRFDIPSDAWAPLGDPVTAVGVKSTARLISGSQAYRFYRIALAPDDGPP